MDIVRTQGQIEATKAAKDRQNDPAAQAAAKAKLEKEGKETTPEAIQKQAYDTAYNQAFTASGYGTGGKVQTAAQAVTAALQGLAGGNIGQAVAGGLSPYVAGVIHDMTTDPVSGKVNTEANAMAHAVWGALAARASDNSALAGATGAASGELMARYIAGELYPGKQMGELSEEQKQTLSALGTLAAGLAGGIAGDSTADAVTAAQAGKNAVTNNLFGGTEWMQEEKAREHGADVLSCSDNPGSEACQRGIAENKAYAGALATAGLIYLPGGMQATAGIGGTTNAGIQYLINGEVNPTDVLIASYVGAATAGTGLWGTVGWNTAGGATSNYLKGDDPLAGAGWGAAGSAFGYGMGKYLIETPLNKFINPNWKNWEWTDVGMGISKPLPLDPRPAMWGNIIAAGATESSSQGGSKAVDEVKDKEGK